MDLFDRISNTLSEVSKDGLSIARDLKDTTKITMEIKEREGAIQRAYRSLGKAYYQTHKDDAEFEFDEMQRIKDAFAQIGELQASKDEIRGVKRCPECGEVINVHAKFCSNCGSKAPVPPEPEKEIFECDVVDENNEPVEATEEPIPEEADDVVEETVEEAVEETVTETTEA